MNAYPDVRRAQRQAALLEIIAARDLGTQQDLVEALQQQGWSVTQSSVSRDIQELGVVKVAGIYRTAAPVKPDPGVVWRSWVRGARKAGPHLLVLRCDIGCAQPVAVALDKLQPAGVVGTLAGDDTVFVAVGHPSAATRLTRSLGLRLEKT